MLERQMPGLLVGEGEGVGGELELRGPPQHSCILFPSSHDISAASGSQEVGVVSAPDVPASASPPLSPEVGTSTGITVSSTPMSSVSVSLLL